MRQLQSAVRNRWPTQLAMAQLGKVLCGCRSSTCADPSGHNLFNDLVGHDVSMNPRGTARQPELHVALPKYPTLWLRRPKPGLQNPLSVGVQRQCQLIAH